MAYAWQKFTSPVWRLEVWDQGARNACGSCWGPSSGFKTATFSSYPHMGKIEGALLYGNNLSSWGLYPYDLINYQRPTCWYCHIMVVLYAFYGDTFSLLQEALHLAGTELAPALPHMYEGGDTRMKKTQFSLKVKSIYWASAVYWADHIRDIGFSLKAFKTGDIIDNFDWEFWFRNETSKEISRGC